MTAGPNVAGPELRVYLLVEDLQQQFAAYMSTPTRARGYPPYGGQHSLIIEVAPGLAIERVIALALEEVYSRLGQGLDETNHSSVVNFGLVQFSNYQPM